jgi:acetyltransferase-like isoleucine patch superfamily enzyme
MRTEKKISKIDKTVHKIKSIVGPDALVREYCVIHDSEIGRGCRIYERVSIKKSKIGTGTDINAGTYIEFAEIENEVQIGPNCSIVGIFHQLSEKGAERKDSFKKITIGKRVFIGANCVILPGVEIGEGTVIGAGSTVTKNIPSFHICIGVPPNQTIMNLKEWLNRGLGWR